MARMKIWTAFLGLSPVLLPAAAFAAPLDLKLDIGGEYHFALVNTDDGLNPEAKQVKETDFVTRSAKVAIRGSLSEGISWNVLYLLDTNRLERYWLSNKVSDEFDVNIGLQKVKTYGWHRRQASAANVPVRGAIAAFNPLTDKLGVDLVYKLAGTLSLGFFKDYYDTTATCTPTGEGCNSWNGYDVQKQPAVVFEWVGNFGEFQPLLQYSSYDRNHSSSVSAGVRYKTEKVDTYLDYTLDTRNRKGTDASGKAEDDKTTYSGIVLYGEYKVADYTPYWHFSTLDVDQFVESGVADIEINADNRLDDNEQTVSLGSYFDGYSSAYRPYAGVALTSGKFVDPKDATKKETRTKTDILVGLLGKF